VALARALVIQPTLLLLDESLSALDKNLRVEIQVELRSIQKMTGITAIFVTHDQEEALTLSDRIAVLEHGRIVQMDTPEAIYERPVNGFVAGFLGKANFMRGRISQADTSDYRFTLANGHTFLFEANGAMPTGRECTLTVRPEKLRLSRESTAPTGMNGIVRFVTYAGNQTLFRVEAAGQTIEVQMQNEAGHQTFQAGENVHIAWDKASTLILDVA
jgi:ABC-type Fe3+/spermidine/putrescine transport system ATPase subunit